MINKIIDIAFSGFWSFIGVTILIYIRLATTNPFDPLDADGDWKNEQKYED